MDKLEKAFNNFEKREEEIGNRWSPETIAKVATPEAPVDEFQSEIKETAKVLLNSIKSSASSTYALEAAELAKLATAVCALQTTFYGKDEKAGDTIVMTSQLSMFKGMLK